MIAALVFALAQDQIEIDKSVARGVEYLRANAAKSGLRFEGQGGHTLEELLLAAYVYGGLPEEHEDVQKLLKIVLERPPARVYEAVFLCVALDKLDNEFYLWKIAECAQFLLDNQCENGQWSYGKPGAPNRRLPADLRAWGAQRRKSKDQGTKTKPRIELKPSGRGEATGDNSNAQIAALGIRIASDAGVVFPAANLERAKNWWLSCQWKDGSWGYAGLDYGQGYMTMTAGGMSSLLLLTRSKDPRVDAAVDRANKWMAANFTFHPEYGEVMGAPYSHYSVERAGILGRMDKIGEHAWYAEGAKDLLESQKADGSWTTNVRRAGSDDQKVAWAVIDTCLAILFFKRSVRPPVATK